MDPRVTELHCIMPMANARSVIEHGILSYDRASKLQHRSVAMQPVQDRRDQKRVPGGLTLHQYANLYFHARNPMMFKRQDEAPGLCVLRVSTAVFGRAGTIITDCNAASDYVRFLAPSQWEFLNFDDIFALDWRHVGDAARFYQHKSRKCAEVLVQDRVEVGLIMGAYVVNDAARIRLNEMTPGLSVTIDSALFFR